MNKLAVIFVGQGSQHPGMGLDFLASFPNLEKKIQTASTILGYDVFPYLNSHDDVLKQTKYTQPLLLLASLLAYEAFMTLKPQVFAYAGFSLGEYGAYYGASILSFSQTMRIINKRAMLMDECSQKHPGKMVAVLGMDLAKLEEVAKNSGVFVANYNSPSQVVVSGEVDNINHFVFEAIKNGAKRCLPLSVSGAFHSPLMEEAQNNLAYFLKNEQFKEPKKIVYVNVTGELLVVDEIKQTMAKQISSPVLFTKMMENMNQDGITHILEMGPGTVLSGLINKINPQMQISHLGKLADWDNVKGWLKEHGFIE
jgi:[acyl-carrier-protein] S-malonyltransferase